MVACALLLGSASARAAGSAVALAVPEHRGCPDERAFRDRVTARLAAPLVDRLDKLRVHVRISESDDPEMLVGSLLVERAGGDGGSGYARAFQSSSCTELADALALALSLFIAQSAEDERANEQTVKADPGEAKAKEEVPRVAPEWAVGGGVGLSEGDSPKPVGIASVFTDLRVSVLRLTLEGHATFPSGVNTPQGRIQVRTFGGLAAVCTDVWWFFGCATGEIDERMVSAINVVDGRTATGLLVAAGLRAGIALPLGTRFLLRGTLDGLYSLKPDRVALAGEEVYEFAPGILRATFGAGVRF